MNQHGTRFAAVLLLAAAAVAVLVGRQGPSAPPPAPPLPFDGDLGGSGPVIRVAREPAAAAAPAERAGAADAEASAAAHELHVRGDRGSASGQQVAVELLFGSQLATQPQTMRLVLDDGGHAVLPLAAGATLPSRAEFAFPTLGGSGRAIAAGASEVELVLPPCGALEFEVVEVDGSPAVEAVVVELRHANAPWPANRWLAVPIERGRGACPAEVGDYVLEVRVRGTSLRQATATMRGPDAVDERVRQRLELPAWPALVLQPKLITPPTFDGGVRVEVHLLAPDVSLVAHALPERPGCFAVHPSPALRRTGWTVVQITGRSLADPEQGWAGELSLDVARSMDLPAPIVVQVRPVEIGR